MFPTSGLGALAIDYNNPDTLYAGTGFWFNTISGSNVFGSAPRGSGMFRSRDAGGTWEKVGDPGAAHFRYITRIAVSRVDSQRIYASTWSGIFRSLDAGATWTHVFNRAAAGQNGCQDMVLRTDQATDYLFAACGTTAAGGAAIFRNTDAAGEAPWERVFSVPAMGNTTLALAPSNQSIIYALMASNGADEARWNASLHGVYRSVDNGAPETWEARVLNTNPEPSNTGLLSNNGGFYRCTATAAQSIGGQGWIHNAIAVDPQDPDTVYVGGIDIYRSDDGGQNWGIASFWQAADGPNGAHADVLGLVFPPDYDRESKPHVYAATDGGIYLTLNALAELARGERAGCAPFQNKVAWAPLHTGYQTTQFYTGAVAPGGGAFLGGKQDNGTMRGTLAGQRDWIRIRGGDGAGVYIDPRDPNTVFASTQNLNLARSRNGGRSFAAAMRGITEPASNFTFISPVAVDSSNPDRMYVGGRTLWRTSNQADNWEAMSAPIPTAQGNVSAIAVSPVDGRVLAATTQGFIFRTADPQAATNETVWENTRPRPGYVPHLAFDPDDANTAYAVYSQFNTAAGQSHIYRTTDGGVTWEGIDGSGDTGIPDMPVLTLTIDPQDRRKLYAGTDIGVFVSQDGGATWARDVSPFASVPTERLILERGAGATHLYAFTFGRGVWRTELPGSGSPCAYKLGAIAPVTAVGGSFSVPVETGEECVWSATPQPGALDVAGPATGKGSGAVRVTLPLNTSTAARRSGFWLHDQAFTATQPGATQLPVAADAFATAPVLRELPFVGIRDTRLTTVETSDPTPSCTSIAPAKTIWLRLVAPASGTVEVISQGQRYDVFGNSGLIVSAWSANAAGALGDELGCTVTPRGTGPWVLSNFRIPVLAGQAYFVLASATGNAAADGGYTVLGLRMVE
jgi:photosystem II stability/assembly factor-like uncharacterized protein